jgi:hypothetical protein
LENRPEFPLLLLNAANDNDGAYVERNYTLL